MDLRSRHEPPCPRLSRKAVRARGRFPNEAAASNWVCMALMNVVPTGKGRRRGTMRWKAPLNAFEGRLAPTTSH